MSEDPLRRLRHDLRSPLMVIAGFAQLLGRDGPVSDEQRREYAGRIEAACEEMNRLVDDLRPAD